MNIDNLKFDPVVIPMKLAQQVIPCGYRQLFDLINAGKIDSVKMGRRRMIVFESIRRYHLSLPVRLTPTQRKRQAEAAAATLPPDEAT